MEGIQWHQRYSRKWSGYMLVLCCFYVPGTFAADSQLLLAANGMIQKGKPLDAFDLLSPYEFEYAGEKEFDYLLGLSLLDSGEPGKSVFAFQRILTQDPNFAGARLELARAYFDMSEYNLSRSEFTTLLA
jgi:outer membrane protein